MKLVHKGGYRYEAWQEGVLLGSFPDYDDPLGPLPFHAWRQEMSHKAIYGCTLMEHRAKQARIAWMHKNPGKTPPDLEEFSKLPDYRKRLRKIDEKTH